MFRCYERQRAKASHTLGGAVIHTSIRQTRGLRQTMPVWVAIIDAPVYMGERGGGGRGECGLRSAVSAVIHT